MTDFNIINPQNREITNTLTPSLSFQLIENRGTVKYIIDISNTKDFSGIVYTYSQIENSIIPQLLVHCDGNEGDTVFTDSSPSAHPITNFLNGVKKTQLTKAIGNASAFSSYDSLPFYNYLSIPNNTDFDFDDDLAFTIEGYVKHSEIIVGSNVSRMAQKYDSAGGNTGWQIVLDNVSKIPVFKAWDAGVLKVNLAGPVSKSINNTWQHVAVVGYAEVGRPIALFVGGIKAGQANGDFNINSVAKLTCFYNAAGQQSAWFDELRVLNGVSRYYEDFIPYTTPFYDAAMPNGNILQWEKPFYKSQDIVSFQPPAGVLSEGDWYWRIKAYPADYCDTEIAQSSVQAFTIYDAAYPWRVGVVGSEVEFIPSNTTVTEEIVRWGRRNIIKHKFTVDFAHMSESKRNELYDVYQQKTALIFYDNRGNSYFVYWGESDRSLDGTAHQPHTSVFGIDRSNLIAGALKWNGTSVFSEV